MMSPHTPITMKSDGRLNRVASEGDGNKGFDMSIMVQLGNHHVIDPQILDLLIPDEQKRVTWVMIGYE